MKQSPLRSKHAPMSVGAAIVFFALLAGCGESETNVQSGNRTGTLHWGNSAEPQALDPHIATGVPEHHIIGALMEGLVVKNRDTLKPIPGMAKDWSISDDGLVYTFTIRGDARWSNGDVLNAHDFAWSWWRALQPKLGNLYAYMYFPIANARQYYQGDIEDFSEVGIVAIDDLTLEVTLENPTPYFLQLLDHYSLFPVHRATIEQHGEPDERGTRWTYAGNMVSNGAFKLTEWEINRAVIVDKNPHYYASDDVRLNRVVFYPTENQTTEERMFRAGQLHYTGDVPIDKIETYRAAKNPALKINPYLGTYFYRLNMRVPHLQDSRVRRALAMTIDRQLITDKVLKAGQIPAYAMTPPNTLGYYPPTTFSFDPAAARKLLADAGYPNGDGFPVTEILYNTNEAHRKVAIAIQQMWREHLNIEVQLLNQEWKVYLDSESSGDYQISRAGWIGDYVDPNNFLDMWLCGGGNNRTGWCNPEYDRLILEQAPSAATEAERHAIFKRAETILLEDLPVLPIYTYTSKHLQHPSVKNVASNILNQNYFRDIYLQPASD